MIACSGNTSNMKSHLNSKHSDLLDKKQQRQPKIREFAFSKTKKDVLDREMAILCATRSLALHLVETDEFKRFMSFSVPGYQTPSVKTLKFNHLFPMANQIRDKITQEAADKKISLTTDLWSNLKQESFLGLTSHFVQDGRKKNVILECVRFEG